MTGAQVAVPSIHIGETLWEAFDNLRLQGRRSALALLGILIGTASIIAMLNIGHIAQLETLKLFSSLGADMLQIQAVPTGSGEAAFTRERLEQLPSHDPDILTVTPLATGRSTALAGSRQVDLAVAGITPSFADMVKLPLKNGRFIDTVDSCSLVVVAGAEAASQLSSPGAQLLPGSRIGIGGYIFIVIGILDPTKPEVLSPVDYNNGLLIPLNCARRVLISSNPNSAIIKVRSGVNVDEVATRYSSALSGPTLSVNVVSARQMIDVMNQQKLVHSRMLTAIGGISLLVGGIGVMNVMLMSLMERRREIGLRTAIGATPKDIKIMFLIEAAILALLGGIGGTFLGVISAFILAKASGWTFDIAVNVLPLGPGLAGIVGLVFGIYPAITAAKLRPIEALRAD